VVASRRISVRRSPIHGRGVFALTRIAAGEFILDYAGERIDAEEAARRYQDSEEGHTFFFDIGDGWIIDGGSGGNASRWINHACEPNVVAEVDGDTVSILAARDIEPGEELLLDYQLVIDEGYSDEELSWYACACGLPGCRQTMLSA
jgi:SET domain-containing protein